MRNLHPPEGLGFIVRTAGVDRDEEDLSRDLNYLVRLWETIVGKIKSTPGPTEIYAESDMMIRTMRDIYTAEIDAVLIDEDEAYERAREFMKIVMSPDPRRGLALLVDTFGIKPISTPEEDLAAILARGGAPVYIRVPSGDRNDFLRKSSLQ